MPAVYAHDSFGKIVSKQLEGDIKEVIRNYFAQYRIGLQGPDFLFFYRPFQKNAVNQVGYRIHKESAKGFMEHAKWVVQNYGTDSAEYAYILGVICHFALDSECHGYVDEMIEKTGVGHIEIESEFEKYLLRRAKKDALSYPMGKCIPTDWFTADCMQRFYEGISTKDTQEALKSMRWCKSTLVSPKKAKQKMLEGVMKLSGKYEDLHGHMLKIEDNPLCKESNKGLWNRYRNAFPVAVELIHNFDEAVRNGNKLSERFDRDFE